MDEQKISLDCFTLGKVKLLPNDGLFSEWEFINKNGALTDTDEDKKGSTREPHPDLVTKIETLKPFLAKMWGINYAVVIAESKDFGGDPKHIDAMKRAYLERLKDIVVTSISVKGKDEKMAVVITGKMRMYKNIFQPMNSGRIQINQKLYGFENDLQDLVPKICEEVFEYLFNGKCANPTLFGADEQKEPKEIKAEDLLSKKPKRKVGEPQAEMKTV